MRLLSLLLLSRSSVEAKRVVVVGAGWGGLSAAHHLSKTPGVEVTVVDAAPRPGGLVSDSWRTPGGRRAEAGQHGFWDEYSNIFGLMDEIGLDRDAVLTDYAEQGQYSPGGLEAVWPIYRASRPFGESGPFSGGLPTGLGQALYTRFKNLSPLDLATAAPLVLAFSEFDDSEEAWAKYDKISFRDLCTKLGVSRRMYKEAFEPMILTGLFAPGEECSAAAALGMAYFFVLKHQTSFDVRWCKGNVGETIFQPWVEGMKSRGVRFLPSTRATDFEVGADGRIDCVVCRATGGNPLMPGGTPTPDSSGVPANTEVRLEADDVVFAVGAAALNGMVRGSRALSQYAEWRRYANLRGLSVLATRLFLDREVPTQYTANACWGFDEGVGMTWFDIKKLHAPALDGEVGSVIEVDYYHANTLLLLSDEQITAKAKRDLDAMLGSDCQAASVVDSAVVKLPNAVNWYFPGSYDSMPDLASSAIPNAYFVGDLVRTRHGSWSQEKAYVTGLQAANVIAGREPDDGVVPLKPDEPHVAAGRSAVSLAQTVLGGGEARRGPSLVDFLW